jgi:hypothetical protein
MATIIVNGFFTLMLPFQGDVIVGDFYPTRWVGLAYIALSGRRKLQKLNILKSLIIIERKRQCPQHYHQH